VKVLLQRVRQAAVDVAGERIAEIGPGLLALVGVAPQDGDEQIRWLADKTLGLRIFPDQDKPMNRSLLDVGGEILVVSQFTLTADTSRGKRPGFSTAAAPELAEQIYLRFVAELEKTLPVQTGRFGADMQVALINDGPVTFMLER
jgi:D-tyrosyl-tRNA(Tyr) deacylase